MKFVFTDKKVDVPDTLHDYAEKKISKLDRYFKSDAEAFVTFSIERGRHNVEVTVRNSGMYFRVSESTNDMYASIDSAVASIERQIHKNKTRLEKKLRQGAFAKDIQSVSFMGNEPEPEDDLTIIRTKRFLIKPISAEEAVLQMNLLGHDFYVFKNQDSDGRFAVVYRRHGNTYGLIDTDDDTND